MPDRKPRPLWPYLAAVLIGLPLLYLVSFGAGCRLTARTTVGQKTFKRPMIIFWPLAAAARSVSGTGPVREVHVNPWLESWVKLWLPEGHSVGVPASSDGSTMVWFGL